MVTLQEAQELHELIGSTIDAIRGATGREDLAAPLEIADLVRAREIAATIVSDITPRQSFGWTWIDGEDDNAGNAWIQISPLEDGIYASDEMAIIMCRNYERVRVEHPEWIENMEFEAQTIVDALNARFPYAGDYLSAVVAHSFSTATSAKGQ